MSAARGRITEANTAVAPASGASEEGVTSDPNLERTSSKRPCVRENFSFASSAVSHPDYEKKNKIYILLGGNTKYQSMYIIHVDFKVETYLDCPNSLKERASPIQLLPCYHESIWSPATIKTF